MSGFTATDRRYMQAALDVAGQGLYSSDPNPRVGCVLVRQGRIVASGAHLRAGEAHAEINALRAAGLAAQGAQGAHAYVSLEPCCHQGRTGPCTQALIDAGVSAVTYARDDADPKVAGRATGILRAAGIAVRSGLLADQALYLNRGCYARHWRGRPWTRLKLAVSLDGRVAASDRSSRWITGEQAREDNQHWRARASAIMTGSGTVKADNPRLNVRLNVRLNAGMEQSAADSVRQPLRVVVSSSFAIPVDAQILQPPGTTLVTGCVDNAAAALLRERGAAVHVLKAAAAPAQANLQQLDLRALLHYLASLEVNELHVECGPTLAGSLMAAGLVDELLLYQADCLLGDQGMAMFRLPGIGSMDDRMLLPAPEQRQLGRDRRLIYTITQPERMH